MDGDYELARGTGMPDSSQKLQSEIAAGDTDPSSEKTKTSSEARKPGKTSSLVDRILTNPFFEAGKTAARFVPGIGIFVIGIDRLTRWKLSYSSNATLVSNLEKKMADITSTYIALVELLPPEERRSNHPRLRIFAKRTGQIKSYITKLQNEIESFDAKPPRERLLAAEHIQSTFNGLQKVLDEIIRDVQLHLGISAADALRRQETHGQGIANVLLAQKEVLTASLKGNSQLLALMQRQTQSFDAFDAKLGVLREEQIPGYARVANLEVRRLWHDFFRWPAFIDRAVFVEQLPLYFQMRNDDVALDIWAWARGGTRFYSDIDGLLKNVLGIDKQRLSALDLSNVFPFNETYYVSIADWIIWKTHAWYAHTKIAMLQRFSSTRITTKSPF